MLFPTITFAVFFLVVWPGAWLVAPWPRARQAFLLLASWVFYAWWDERFLALLIATIVLANVGGRCVAATADRPGRQRLVLAAGIALHLGILGWYKYYGFFASSLTSASPTSASRSIHRCSRWCCRSGSRSSPSRLSAT